mgnify:CR=1 FL=1
MNKIYTSCTLIALSLILISMSANPPDGKTGAPGDSLCTECHTPSNPPINGEITVEGFPTSITPGEDYTLTVVNRNTVGTAKKAGFQMTILGPFNTKAGNMKNASANSVVSVANNRQYFEHNPAQPYPDSSVVKWTVQWTAPELPAGSEITYYAAGNVANGNFMNSGDRIVTTTGKGSIVVSATHDIVLPQPTVYPNPGTDQIRIVLADGTAPDGDVVFYSMAGHPAGQSRITQGVAIAPDLPTGVYILEVRHDDAVAYVRWSKI